MQIKEKNKLYKKYLQLTIPGVKQLMYFFFISSQL